MDAHDLQTLRWHRRRHNAAQQHEKQGCADPFDFRGHRGSTAKVAPRMASRSLRAPGGPRGAAGTPKTAPRGAKGAPRRPHEAPGESQEPARGGFGAALAATLRPPGAQEPTGGLREQFGPRGGSFWKLRGPILDSCGRPFSKHRGSRTPSVKKSAHAKHAMHSTTYLSYHSSYHDHLDWREPRSAYN